jgi:hypothetical protein
MRHIKQASTFIGLAYEGKDIVFLIEYSSSRDFGP